ncbi:hypothetical protein CO661_32565 [Sinorhizobium fredii]|uniref:DUF2274 domain-containing protein n=1 Tax=Rhizobium fredii TaxID=380 RepID=A0A2A6LNF0_RHIFR|nr:DUF2274 domain-containing protein [Sinorhizobium fredii]PDT43875.1 hypothetical protein CO661_32565 [Sinorhizobium fredii]
MTKLKLSAIPDDKPVMITIELPASVFRDLWTYAAILARDGGEPSPPDPAKRTHSEHIASPDCRGLALPSMI